MSHFSNRPILTPTLGKNQECNVLKEKQPNSISISSKVTPKTLYTKKAQIVRPVVKKPILNENKCTTGSKMPARSTPLGKNITSKLSKPISTPHSSHSTSHQNEKMNTPINRNIRPAFGSSTKENSNKKLIQKNSSLSTPLNNRSLASTYLNSNSKARQSPANFVQNSIVNGVDYSAIMERKAELGYSGPGYVVEYDCEDQDLKSVHVNRGLWKITTGAYTPNKNNLMQSKLGVPQYCTRLDVESSALKSPGKPIYGMDIFLNPIKNTNSILRNESKTMRKLNLCENLMGQPLNQTIDIEVPKKKLRWADILEEKKSPTSFILSPYNLTPHHIRNTNATLLTASKSSDNIAGNDTDKPMNKMRRSLSMNDINNIILDNEEEEEEEKSIKTQPNMNETFELETPSKPELLKPKMTESEYTLNKIEETTDNYSKQSNELDNSLNDLKIPFTLDNSNESETVNNKIKNVVKQTNLIKDLQTCANHLKGHINTLGLEEDKQKLHVNTSDFIKISNLICDMHKSLEIYKEKLTFE